MFSELEAVGLDLLDEVRLKAILINLTAVVLVEEPCSAAEGILFVFVVVSFHVSDQTTAHMSVVLTWSQRRCQHGTCLLVQVGTKCPNGHDHYKEVESNERDTLLRALDEGRVKMHVILGVEVVIKNCVNVLKVDNSCVLVRSPQLGVRFVEVATTTTNGHSAHHNLAAAHDLGKHTHIYL